MSGGIRTYVRPPRPNPPARPDITPPPAPAVINATAVSATSVNVTWSAVVDPPSPPGYETSGMGGYRLFRRTGSTGTWSFLKNVGLVLTYLDTTCAPATAYDYKVKGVDVATNPSPLSVASNTVTTETGTAPVGRRNNFGHWVDVPRGQQEIFCVDQAAAEAAYNFTGPAQPGVPRTNPDGTPIVYSSTGTYRGITKTMGASPSYPTADRLNRAGCMGVIMRHYWRQLEEGASAATATYNFSRVAGELAQCLAIGNARGTRFGYILFLEVRDFADVQPAPIYLRPYTSYRASDKTYDMWRHHPTVMNRFALLVQALAAAFDTHPCWEGIAVSETSTVADTDSASGYTPEKYRDALITESNVVAAALVNGRHFFYHNFLPGHQSYLDAVVEAGIDNGAMVLSGPDILENKVSLEKNVYPRFVAFNGALPLMCAAQNDSHHWDKTLRDTTPIPVDAGGPGTPQTMEQVFLFGKDELGLNSLAWTWRRNGAGYQFGDAGGDGEVITENPTWTPSPGWTPP